jgi:hypothetical protein
VAQNVKGAGRDAGRLPMDQKAWSELVLEALHFSASKEFDRLANALAFGLEQWGELNEPALRLIHGITKGQEMEHVVKSASAVVTDAGIFEALAATWITDRQSERISRGAFRKTITRWRNSGRPVPLHWDHRGGDPQYIIGASMTCAKRAKVCLSKDSSTSSGQPLRERVGVQCEAGLSACLLATS